MLYFNSFPKVITTDYKNNSLLLTNIMSRVSIISSILQNPLLFYSYNIKDGDRPDIIADKYYKDVNKFWLVLYSNQIMDPEYDLPITGPKFNDYLAAKYPAIDISGTVYEYRKIITTYDPVSLTTTNRTIVVDLPTYNNIVIGTQTYNFYDTNNNVTGSVTQTISKQSVSILQYEIEQNEAKRNINLISTSYSDQIEKELVNLMRL
jgi:hypothetical protein